VYVVSDCSNIRVVVSVLNFSANESAIAGSRLQCLVGLIAGSAAYRHVLPISGRLAASLSHGAGPGDTL